MNKNMLNFLMLSLGIAVAGLFVMFGLQSLKSGERIVSVRGLSERTVMADHVTWPIPLKGSAETTTAIYEKIAKDKAAITDWLVSNGVKKENISYNAPTVNDLSTNPYSQYKPGKDPRYTYDWTVIVSSNQVALIKELSQRTGELLSKNIAIGSGDYMSGSITFEYTKLNDIKPAMIAEATQNARVAAEKFAKDSNSKVGKIKDAQQGLFSISDRDQFTHDIKTVRVVTSINYYLKD